MTELRLSYEEACSRGYNQSYRIHLAVIGHSEAGKTSFIDRLLGKGFQEQRQSTEGIHTHFITSSFNKNDLDSKKWTEISFESSILEKDFHQSILAQRAFTEPKILKHQEKSPEESTGFFEATFEDDNKYKDTKNAEAFNIDEKFPLSPILRMTSEPLPDPTAAENDYDNLHEDTFTIPEQIGTRTIPTMSSEALSKLLESKQEYEGPPSDDRIPYSINIWDHGGQNEFIITNQLFLNIEAFILMVMDISLDLNIPLKQSSDAKGKFGLPKTPAQILCYWLNALHILAIEKTTEPNIALVLTHQDMIKASDTKKYIESYMDELIKCIKGKPYESYIMNENIFVVDNREGTEGEFAHIRNRIFAQIARQKSWGIERPTRWLKLEADILETAKEAKNPYLHISTVKDLTSSFAMNEKELESFLHFHHTLGDLIYYPNEKLTDIVITNPQWFLDMFKSLITPHEFLLRRKLQPEKLEEMKRAIVSEETLKAIWEESNVQFLKDVMMKFDLMLSLGSEQNNEYLIPCMLQSQDIDMYGQEPFTNMVLIYNTTLKPNQGDAMPVGAFHKLLSQCSKIPCWKVCANDHLSYTDASIEISHGIRLALTLMKTNTIRLSIWSAREVLDDGHLSNNEARELILKAHMTVSQCLKLLALTSSADFKMLCPHWSPGEEYLCLVTVGKKENIPLDGPIFFAKSNQCTIHKKVLESGHFPWTREELNVDLDGKFKYSKHRQNRDNKNNRNGKSLKQIYDLSTLYIQQEISNYNYRPQTKL